VTRASGTKLKIDRVIRATLDDSNVRGIKRNLKVMNISQHKTRIIEKRRCFTTP
jgi:hypothetical protein